MLNPVPRVCRQHIHLPQILPISCLAITVALCLRWTQQVAAQLVGWEQTDPTWWSQLASLIWWAVIPVLLGVVYVRRRHCSHPCWLFLYGFIFGGAGTACTEGNLSLYCAAICGVLCVLTFFAENVFGHRRLTQDGTLCPHCTHDVSHLSTGACPECGREPDDLLAPLTPAAAWEQATNQSYFAVGFLLIAYLLRYWTLNLIAPANHPPW